MRKIYYFTKEGLIMSDKQKLVAVLLFMLGVGMSVTKPCICHALSLAGAVGSAMASAEESRVARENANASFQNLLNSAEQGDVKAQRAVAMCYERGDNYIYQDLEKAFYWYNRAAEQGDSFCQGKVGMAYLWGTGVKRDVKQAFSWFLKGAEQGQPYCQEKVADFYVVGGDVVEKSWKDAYKWYVAGAKKIMLVVS